MVERWKWGLVRTRPAGVVLLVLLVVHLSVVNLCWSLNDEGMALLRFRERIESDPLGALADWEERIGENDPCSWFGVGCRDGKVTTLNLKDLCLRGTLGPELGQLVSVKAIIMRNNLLHGEIPKEIRGLNELEVLDLGYDNLGDLSASHVSPSLVTILVNKKGFRRNFPPKFDRLKMFSQNQADLDQAKNYLSDVTCLRSLISKNGAPGPRRLLQTGYGSNLSDRKTSGTGKWIIKLPPLFRNLPIPHPSPSLSPSPSQVSPSASPTYPPHNSPVGSPTEILPTSPAPVPTLPIPGNPPVVVSAPTPNSFGPTPSRPPSQVVNKKPNHHLAVTIGGSFLLIIVTLVLIKVCQNQKIVTVQPWRTGLSGQLQKAFVTGVPSLKRSDIEAACEDFSNIIGTLSDGTTMYKGTLSSGVEIAVTSSAVTLSKDWPKTLESHFRKKVDTLSKVNHKNFVNLIGFCEEEEPFTRMMVFEYAPNGSLFEHLHIKEAEHLDWRMRLRIAMGIAYCLEHMHQLTPPVIHENLQSSCIFLTEDYAAKLSDMSLLDEITVSMPTAKEPVKPSPASLQNNVYNFGGLLLELVTGRHLLLDEKSVKDWVSEHLQTVEPLETVLDPTLSSFNDEELEKLLKLIKECLDADPNNRPAMANVADRLREITGIRPEEAVPKLSPLWWAELEIISTEE